MDKTRFIALRKSKGFTQATFAAALGVSPGYIGDIERGHRDVSLKLAMKMESELKLPIVAEFVASKSSEAA